MEVALIVAVVAAPTLLVVIVLFGIRGSGKLVRCPNCGFEFKRPATSERQLGIGWSVPPFGTFTCPNCKASRSSRSFKYVRSAAA